MTIEALNPKIHEAHLYERVSRNDECRTYDSRIIYLVSGELSVAVSGEKAVRLSPGGIAYIPRGAVYKLKSKYMRAAIFAFDTVYTPDSETPPRPVPPSDFDEKKLPKNEEIKPFDKPLFLSDMESERDNFISMCESYIACEGNYLASVSARLKLVLIKLAEAVEKNALPTFMVEGLGRYIRENCSEEISGVEIGAIFGYHPYYISSMLKERHGITVKQYVTAYRLKMAKELLAYTVLPIADVADRCGFSDASYFAKIFKQSDGVSPKDYRNRFKDTFI